MKALMFNQAGPPEVLKIVEIPEPSLKPNEILVKIKAASINHVDIWVRKGIAAYPVKLPHVTGADGAGVVENIGSEVEGIEKGDRVVIIPGLSCGECSFCRSHRDNQCDLFEILGAKRRGTYSEYVAVPDQNVVPLPENLSFEEAAAFPLAYWTAWHMLTGRAKLMPQEKVLVVGASSGVAVAAIQIAKAKGAKVFAVTTSSSKVDKIKDLGADEIFLQEGEKDFSKWIHRETQGQGVEVVFEHVGPATFEKSVKSLSRYGRLVTCGATSGPTAPLDFRYFFSRDLTLMGARMGTKKEFQELSHLIFSGKIKSVIDKVFPLEEGPQAHAYIEERKQFGKVLFKI